MNPEIFKAYDIRGVYPDELNEDDAWKIGHATARFLPSLIKGYERGRAESTALCVGRDMRTHSEPLAQALIEGIRSAGVGVIDIGMIDTPQMYFAINHLGTCGGVQVTASHNPAKYNGFKISGKGAIPDRRRYRPQGDQAPGDRSAAHQGQSDRPAGAAGPVARVQEARPAVPPAQPQEEEGGHRRLERHGGQGGAAAVRGRPARDRRDQLRAHGQVQARSRSAEGEQSRPGQGGGARGMAAHFGDLLRRRRRPDDHGR